MTGGLVSLNKRFHLSAVAPPCPLHIWPLASGQGAAWIDKMCMGTYSPVACTYSNRRLYPKHRHPREVTSIPPVGP